MNMAQDPYKYFRVEAREILEELGRGVLEIEKGQPNPDVAPRLLRLAHTLKGAARVVKQAGIAEMAHAIEGALSPLRDLGATIPPGGIDEVLKLLDAISARLSELAPPQERETGAAPRPMLEEPFRTVRAEIAEIDALLDGIGEVGVQLRSMRRAIGGVERARHLADLIVAQIASSRHSDNVRPREGTLSLKTGSLADELADLVSTVEQSLSTCVDRVEREIRQSRDAAERLRLLPVDAVFATLERAVRDLAKSLGKEASLETKGGDIRLDADVVGIVQGALVQVVRNAVAHGIESSAARAIASKQPIGRVEVTVVRRGNRVSFTCRDDGSGIDLEAVRRAAVKKGLVPAQVKTLGADELLRILLTGGLTTSGFVTEVSGRGIGLDIVREAASRLGGEVFVNTEAGRGTSIELVVPVSLASLDALLVEAGGVAAAIPLSSVRRTLRVTAGEVLSTGDVDSVIDEGKVIPFTPLARPLRVKSLPARSVRAWSAVVVDGATALAAVGVDRILGTANLVVRPLPLLAPADPAVAGAFLDAEGTPQLVLDPEGLVAAAARPDRRAAAPDTLPAAPLLIIDDSLTTRKLEQSILESAGYEVDLATSAEEAFEKARKRRYRLFLTDVEMPGIDGFMFVEKTRTDPAFRDIPAILVTSRDSPEDRRRGEEVGASAYIVKSEFDQGQLLETIRRLVG